MIEHIAIDKQVFNKIMEMLDLNDIECSFCGDKITKNNFGIIHHDFYSCKKLTCIVCGLDKEEKRGEQK